MAVNHWIRGAVPKKHEGKFTARADAAGKTVPEYAAEHADAPGTMGKEARLASQLAANLRARMAHVNRTNQRTHQGP